MGDWAIRHPRRPATRATLPRRRLRDHVTAGRCALVLATLALLLTLRPPAGETGHQTAALTPLLDPGAAGASATAVPDGAVARALALIIAPAGNGTAFAVRPNQLLTAAHVVGDNNLVTVAWGDQRTHGRVIARDAQLDVALIQVDETPAWVTPVDWRLPPPLAISQPLWVWGFPHAGSLTAVGYDPAPSVSAGILSARRQLDGRHYLETDAASNPGESGAPLVTADGVVVGIVVSGLTIGDRDPEGLNFALDLRLHWAAVNALLAP